MIAASQRRLTAQITNKFYSSIRKPKRFQSPPKRVRDETMHTYLNRKRNNLHPFARHGSARSAYRLSFRELLTLNLSSAQTVNSIQNTILRLVEYRTISGLSDSLHTVLPVEPRVLPVGPKKSSCKSAFG